MRQDREHRFARGALDTPDGDSTQADTHVMRVARQAPAPATGRLVCELKAKRQHEGEDTLEKCLPIAKQLKVRGFMLKIDGDGTVYACLFGCCAHVSHPQVIRSRKLMRHDGGNTMKYQDHREGLRTLPLNSVECEIFWAGFGFQVWCQMLTYIVRAKHASLLIIDEPDIYLHSDLQRQLIGLLKNIGPDIIIATHSTEIISEAEPNDLLVINKKTASARRIKDPIQLQSVFGVLGSNLNPTLTQLAKSRRAVFVEGADFQIFSAFARKLGKNALANRSDFAVIPAKGFNPQKVCDLSEGIELTLGTTLLKAVIFDRDYRSRDEVETVLSQLGKMAYLAHIHARKEIENYLLDPVVIDRAMKRRIAEHNRRIDKPIVYEEKAEDILKYLTDGLKSKISGHFLSNRSTYEKSKNPGIDQATINQHLLEEFEDIWNSLSQRLEIVPGKEILSQLNKYLQENYKVTLSLTAIVNAMNPGEVCQEIRSLLDKLDDFRTANV